MRGGRVIADAPDRFDSGAQQTPLLRLKLWIFFSTPQHYHTSLYARARCASCAKFVLKMVIFL